MPKDGKVGFAIIGLGIGASRCEMMAKVPEARLVSVCDLLPERARQAAETYGCEWTTDYKTLLERPDIDVIGVYTPSGAHRDIAVTVAQAGKHVLVTKPLEVTVERAEAVVAACAQSGVKLAVEFYSRYSADNYRIYKAIAEGRFGTLVQGEFSFKCWRSQGYYEADGGWRGTWKVDGGGAIINQTIHSVDQMLWYHGEPDTVYALTGTYTHRIEAEDTGAALIRFKNGSVAVLVGSTTFDNDRPPNRYGSGAVKRAEINGEFGSASCLDDKLILWKFSEGAPAPTRELPAAPPVNVFQDYARALLQPGYESPTFVQGRDTLTSVKLVTLPCTNRPGPGSLSRSSSAPAPILMVRRRGTWRSESDPGAGFCGRREWRWG